MSVIFFHRVKIRRRRFIVSALMPYLFILFLGTGSPDRDDRVGCAQVPRQPEHSPVRRRGVARVHIHRAVYLSGVAGEILMLTAIYLVMPVGRLSFRHALIGGIAGLLWEVTRHILVFYYETMAQIQVVYGSLTTAIAALLSVEIGAIVLLFGAQVISEYERIGHERIDVPAKPMKTAAPPPPSA